jgi:hypothetical protein
VSGPLTAPAASPPQSQPPPPRYPLDRRLGGLQSRSGRGGEDKKNPIIPSLFLLQPGQLSRYSDLIRTGRPGNWGSTPGGGWEFSSSTPRPDRLWSTPSLLPRTLFMGVKRPGREAHQSPPPSAEAQECVELYLQSPIRLHGVVLS